MTAVQWTVFTVTWLILTAYSYTRLHQNGTVPVDESGRVGALPCLRLARNLLVVAFGTRYWTWRGLSATAGLCWGHAGILLFLGATRYHIGVSGYPVFEFLAFVVLAVLPFWVHAIFHATRAYLDIAASRPGRYGSYISVLCLPLVPALMVPITLLPVALALGMEDAESIVPRNVGSILLELFHMVTAPWWQPRASGAFPLIGIPLGFPAVVIGSFLASYVTCALWRLLGRLQGSGQVKRSGDSTVGITLVNMFYVFCIAVNMWTSPA